MNWHRVSAFFLCVVCAWFLTACGSLTPGGVQPQAGTDAAPNGAIVAQGTLTGLNGQSVGGIASVYRDNTTGTNIVRLEGISVPNEPALMVQASSSGEVLLKTQIGVYSGNKNYPTSVTGSRRWDSVSIVSSSNAQTPEYGKAILQSTGR